MAEITNNLASFPGVVVSVTYDDATLRILRADVENNSTVSVTVTVKRLTNPKKTYENTWLPGAVTGFSIPTGINYTLDAVDGGISMPGIELFVRYG